MKYRVNEPEIQVWKPPPGAVCRAEPPIEHYDKVVPMKILVVCTGNSARSQMAEGLFRFHGGDSMEVSSAGLEPKGVNPLAVQVMREVGIDISAQYSKDVQEFAGKKFDWVITVCDRARESCPVFEGANKKHWNISDPKDEAEIRQARDL